MKGIKYFSLTVLALLLSFPFLDIQTSAISQPPFFLPQTDNLTLRRTWKGSGIQKIDISSLMAQEN